MEFKTGTLIEFRSRPWVVQQSKDPELLVIKPLGGTDAEIVGLYKPLYGNELDNIKSYDFRKPSIEDIGANSYPGAARILYNACRLSFRDIAGPFQCLGRLSFEPRPYQMVPLILGLKQEKNIRLLISDDVGIGKTLESLLIAKELLDRREINRFAVICLPHLCEQWQNEIRDKFGLEAEIVRSSTISRLEKKLRANENIFRDIPFQIISVDYIKSSERKAMFIQHCPEFVIVDEAHTCARPKGANNSQQQRFALLHELSKTDRHLVLLTATPHSGNMEEFQSVIGLLKPEFENYSLDNQNERQELSKYFIQRRRADVKPYIGNDIVFPVRNQVDEIYQLSGKYQGLLFDVIDYVKKSVKQAEKEKKVKQRYIYWDLLALIRGIMSSPAAGVSMLENKIAKKAADQDNEDVADLQAAQLRKFNESLKDGFFSDDILPESYEESSNTEKKEFKSFIEELKSIQEHDLDTKVKKTVSLASSMLAEGKNPIVFCQYIQTAEYVKNYIERQLKSNKKYKDVVVEVVTSKLADEERKMKIDELSKTDRHVLVCTDCLSEGVNLQNGFEAIIHYDLPWNPNRVEQRNGRIDRFGQTAPEVLVCSIYDENNPVDNIIMKVLYRKQNQIRRDLGIYIPIADNDSSLMESIMNRIIVLDTKPKEQLNLFTEADFIDSSAEHDKRLERAMEVEKKSHTYFAHNTKAMDPTSLIASLDEAKKVIGDTLDTRDFVISELQHAGVVVNQDAAPLSYSFQFLTLPTMLQPYFAKEQAKNKGTVKISFASPTPKGYMYIGRNHTFVEDLSRKVVNETINNGELAAGRAMVVETACVQKKTTVLLMRVRSVIGEIRHQEKQIVGEEMMFLGYEGNITDQNFIEEKECQNLFLNVSASGSIDPVSQRRLFGSQMEWIYREDSLRQYTDGFALERAQKLVESFTMYRKYLATSEYQVVKPVLPMDVIAAYVFVPKM